MRDQRDEVGRIVRESAEANGRCWAIMYDVSGVREAPRRRCSIAELREHRSRMTAFNAS
jgi:hypothetical protein